ncbi:MAG TPA: ribonuclease HI family protein [Urbifossiella sp.]|jgi:ribonuclease HI|nr:ribonuclease HI family protein [Urbifossiella sp.]
MSDLPTMNVDGASRGNPGPAAFAFVIARPGLPPVEEAQTLGKTTNNVAEYTALVRGLEAAADLGLKRLAVFSDSELLVHQMNGVYRVKHPDLLPLYEEARELVKEFESVSIAHVRREQNKRADALCNQVLDGQAGKSKKPMAAASQPKTAISDAAVRADAIAILQTAAQAWASRGLAAVPPDAIWDQLWFLMEEGGVLKRK